MTDHMEPTVLYHVYPLGCLGADQTGADRSCRRSLRELVDWLPHVESLGADALMLGPVFASLSHGYDTVSHREIDDRLGTVAELDALVAAAAARGIGVVLDGAFAYASRGFHRHADPAEADEPWFLRDDAGALVPWRVDSLVTPDYGAEGYRAYVADTMTFWLDRGVAGWRLDSAWSVPATFWRRVLARVRAAHPTAWLLGQFFDDDLPPLVNSTTVSGMTEYALMHGTREWLSGGPVEDMVATLRVHRHNADGRTPPHTFVGNHDFARLADAVPTAALPLAFVVLLTLPGRPAIYYGDEGALTSSWTDGGSDALLRPAATPSDLGGEPITTVRSLGGFRRANPWLTRAELGAVDATDGVLGYTVAGPDRAIRVLINPTAQARPVPAGEPLLGSPAGGAAELAPWGWQVRPA